MQDSADRPITLDDVRTLIEDALALKMPPADLQCRAEFPHDTLVYVRGPNTYHCRCGKTYMKDGRGGLREAS